MRFGDVRQFASRHDTGRATIPDDLRAQIDQAVAEGRVTRVPRGVSGQLPLVYDPKLGQIVTTERENLRAINARMAAKSQKARRARLAREAANGDVQGQGAVVVRIRQAPKNPNRDQLMAERQKNLAATAEMRRDGATTAEIAAALKLSEKTVTNYIWHLRKSGVDIKRIDPGVARRDGNDMCLRALELQRAGLTVAEIAEKLNRHHRQTEVLLHRARAIEMREKKVSPERQAKLRRMGQMLRDGASFQSVAAAIGWSVRTVRTYASEARTLGAEIPRQKSGTPQRDDDDFCLAVLGLHRSGKTYVQISAEVDRTKDQVAHLLFRARQIERNRQGQAIAAE